MSAQTQQKGVNKAEQQAIDAEQNQAKQKAAAKGVHEACDAIRIEIEDKGVGIKAYRLMVKDELKDVKKGLEKDDKRRFTKVFEAVMRIVTQKGWDEQAKADLKKFVKGAGKANWQEFAAVFGMLSKDQKDSVIGTLIEDDAQVIEPLIKVNRTGYTIIKAAVQGLNVKNQFEVSERLAKKLVEGFLEELSEDDYQDEIVKGIKDLAANVNKAYADKGVRMPGGLESWVYAQAAAGLTEGVTMLEQRIKDAGSCIKKAK